MPELCAALGVGLWRRCRKTPPAGRPGLELRGARSALGGESGWVGAFKLSGWGAHERVGGDAGGGAARQQPKKRRREQHPGQRQWRQQHGGGGGGARTLCIASRSRRLSRIRDSWIKTRVLDQNPQPQRASKLLRSRVCFAAGEPPRSAATYPKAGADAAPPVCNLRAADTRRALRGPKAPPRARRSSG